MAFLDNSGDVLLDVVLTAEGRKRLAAGTFKPTKYALEIRRSIMVCTTQQTQVVQPITILRFYKPQSKVR